MTTRRKVELALAAALAAVTLALAGEMLLTAHRHKRIDRLLEALLSSDKATVEAAKAELAKTRNPESLRYLATHLFYEGDFELPRSGTPYLVSSRWATIGTSVADILARVGEPAIEPTCNTAEAALSAVPSGWRRLRIAMASWACLPESLQSAARPRAQYAQMAHVARALKAIGPRAAPRVAEMLKSGEPMRYALAVHCLSRFEDPAALDAVLAELSSPLAAVRLAAASAVAMDEGSMHVQNLDNLFWVPRIDMPRPTIIAAGLESPDRAVREAFIGLISSHASDCHYSVRTYAVVTPIKDPRVYEILLTLFLNPLESAETRRTAELARIWLYEDPYFEPRMESTDAQ